MKQHEIWRLGDDLIVPTEDGQWTIEYAAAAQDVAEVRRINKRYGANLACCGRCRWSCGNAGWTASLGIVTGAKCRRRRAKRDRHPATPHRGVS
jgi:hypothetical protein